MPRRKFRRAPTPGWLDLKRWEAEEDPPEAPHSEPDPPAPHLDFTLTGASNRLQSQLKA
jgi:hypothetical protein